MPSQGGPGGRLFDCAQGPRENGAETIPPSKVERLQLYTAIPISNPLVQSALWQSKAGVHTHAAVTHMQSSVDMFHDGFQQCFLRVLFGACSAYQPAHTVRVLVPRATCCLKRKPRVELVHVTILSEKWKPRGFNCRVGFGVPVHCTAPSLTSGMLCMILVCVFSFA